MSRENSLLTARPLSDKRRKFVIETERLVLRQPVAADAKAIAILANDIRVVQHTARLPHPYRLKDAESFIAHMAQCGAEDVFLITRDDEAIGIIGLTVTAPDAVELGYWLGVEAWGQGFATEAARAIVDHAFETRGIEKVLSGARVINPASRRVLEKCGLRWTGVKLLRFLALGYSAPVDRFALDRAGWTSLKTFRNSRRQSRPQRDITSLELSV